MKGLMRNNYYAAFSNAKVFAIIMLLSGVSAVAVGKKSTLLMIGYMLLSMIGSPSIRLRACEKKAQENGANTSSPHL